MAQLKGLDKYGSDAALAAVPLFVGYPDALLYFASACCVILMIIGIPGNIITAIALARCRKIRNATTIFIINLSLADLMCCCFKLSLAASTYWRRMWTHGIDLCRLYPMVKFSIIAVSHLTVLSITIYRYVMISHPILYRRLNKNYYIYIVIAAIWVISWGMFMLSYIEVWGRFSLDPMIGCTIIPDKNGKSPKTFMYVVAYLIPSILILVCYTRIIWVVGKTAKKSRARVGTREKPIIKIDASNVETPETLQTLEKKTIKKYDKSRLEVPSIVSSEPSSSCTQTRECDEASELSEETSDNMGSIRIKTLFKKSFQKSTAFVRSRMSTKKERQLLKMSLVVVITFWVCHLPTTLIQMICPYELHPYLNIFSHTLLNLTPCLNPLIYVVMSIEYRQAYKTCLQCQCRWPRAH